MLHRLGKTKTRIHQQLVAGDTGVHAGGDALLQERDHLGDDIFVAGVVLHGAGLALHVHHAHRQTGTGGGLEGARTAQ